MSASDEVSLSLINSLLKSFRSTCMIVMLIPVRVGYKLLHVQICIIGCFSECQGFAACGQEKFCWRGIAKRGEKFSCP